MDAPQMKATRKVLYITLMLLTGSINTVSKKIQNGTLTEGIDGVSKLWTKPWWQTGVMFLGETLNIVFYAVLMKTRKHNTKKKNEAAPMIGSIPDDQGGSLIGNDGDMSTDAASSEAGKTESESESVHAPAAEPAAPQKQPMTTQRFLLLGIVLSGCDLISTSLQGIALTIISASIVQMLRGAVIIFTGLFSVLFLKRHLHSYQWIGIFIVFLGLVLVGVSGFLVTEETPEEPVEGASAPGPLGTFVLSLVSSVSGGRISATVKAADEPSAGEVVGAMLLTVAGQLFSATQFVIEEKFMKELDMHPLKIVGIEGIIGFILTELVVLPILMLIPGSDYGGVYENFLDAWVGCFNDPLLLSMILLYLISIAFFNFFSLSISKMLSSVHRTLFDALRTIVVWVVMVIIYYCNWSNEADQRYGEPLTLWTILQAFGFVMMVFGTMYNRNLWNMSIKSLQCLGIYKKDEVCSRERRHSKKKQAAKSLVENDGDSAKSSD